MYKMRLIFSKNESARFISHLDLMKVFQRSLSRSGLPVWYTEGFNRHIYVSIALPLPVGYCGCREILDFQMDEKAFDPKDALDRLNRALPAGICGIALETAVRPVREIGFGCYQIGLDSPALSEETAAQAEKLLCSADFDLIKKSKSSEKTVLLRDYMMGKPRLERAESGACLKIILSVGQETLSPSSVVSALEARLPAFAGADRHIARLQILDKKGAPFIP